jgi:hypothetical protein
MFTPFGRIDEKDSSLCFDSDLGGRLVKSVSRCGKIFSSRAARSFSVLRNATFNAVSGERFQEIIRGMIFEGCDGMLVVRSDKEIRRLTQDQAVCKSETTPNR